MADKSLPDFSGDGKDVFIEYGPGGRELDDAREEKGVHEGLSTSAAAGSDTSIDTFTERSS